jgi:hypothetical protein
LIDISRLHEFRYYAANLLKIKTEKRQIVPFIFNIEQERLHKVWEWQLKTMGMVRLIILKDRRIGASTYIDGRQFHQTTTIPNTGGFIVTHDKASLGKIFGMAKLFYDALPKDYRPMKRYSNKTELVFENPVEKERFTNPGLRSFMEVFSAATGTASRSGGYSFAHFSEVAFYDNAEALITSTVPSVMDLPGTVKVYESTGNGRQGFFYEQWRKARKSLNSPRKLSNFYPIFFGWLTFPEYTKPFHSKQERVDLIGTLDEEELYLIQKFKATHEQLNWRRSKILDFDDDIEKFHQEYPSDDEEAFVSKGTPYFSKRLLLQLRNKCKSPLKRGKVSELGFVENEDGEFSIWEFPEKGAEYVVAADAGEGKVDNDPLHYDPSVVQVLKAPKGSPLIKQVAEWKGYIDPTMFAGVIAAIGNMYNEGLAVPENKHPGLTTIAELKHIYWNIYHWTYIDRFKNAESTKLGWETNSATKPIGCSYLATCLMAGILEINSEDLVDEMLAFIRNTSNSGEADYNCHDDLVMAYMIGVFCLGNAYNVGSLLQKLGQFTEKQGEQKKKSYFDPAKHDLAFIQGEDDLVGAGDMTWLTY